MPPPQLDLKARCLGCGYLLRELQETRCPECGRPFDPTDRSTYRLPTTLDPRVDAVARALNATWRAARSPYGQRVCLAIVLLMHSLVWPIKQIRQPMRLYPATFPFTLIMLLSVVAILVIAALPFRRRVGHYLAVTLVAVALACNLGYDSCPHARYLSIGPVIFSISGRPCRNPRHPTTLFSWLRDIRNPWLTGLYST